MEEIIWTFEEMPATHWRSANAESGQIIGIRKMESEDNVSAEVFGLMVDEDSVLH